MEPEHTAEVHLLLGKAAHPEVDVVEARLLAGPGAFRVEEVETIRRSTRAAEDQQGCGGPLALHGGRGGNQVMLAVGRDEIDDRQRVLEIEREVGPAHVGLHLRVLSRHLVELRAGLVEGRQAEIAATGDVERREVERDADELVAQHVGHELVDLVAVLAGHAADDRAGSSIVVNGV